MQEGLGLKFASKYFGLYKVTKVLRNNRYLVQKVGEHEGSQQTSTAVDFIKLWLKGGSDVDDEEYEEEDVDQQIDEIEQKDIRGRMSVQDGRV